MKTWLEVDVKLPWVKEGVVKLGRWTQGRPNEIHTLASHNEGETWHIRFDPSGMSFFPREVEFLTKPIRYTERLTWGGRIKEEVN